MSTRSSSPTFCAIRFFLFLLTFAVTLAKGQTAPVQVKQTDQSIELQNGLVRLTLDKKNKSLDSLHYTVNGREIEVSDGMHLDANREKDYNEEAPPKDSQLVRPLRNATTRLAVARSTADIAEVIAVAEATPQFAFRTEAHWLLRRGDPGFYFYTTMRHGPGMAAVSLVQARTVMGGLSGTNLYTHYIVDDQRMKPFPTGDILETVQDATDRYASGEIYTKYDYLAYVADELVYGMAGNGIGLWMIMPGREYINGGPLHQELTVHRGLRGTGDTKGNVLLWMFQGCHSGASPITLKANESWGQCYGPVFIYCNHAANIPALWQDAKTRANTEESAWPYQFINHSEYPLRRSTVSGKIKFPDGSAPRNAWAILAPPGTNDWSMTDGGYTFWTHTDDSGAFIFPKVRPGRYRLFISGGDQFIDYRKDNVVVYNGEKLDLGTLNWLPVTHGHTLWQIGTPDRSTREFKRGDDVRHFDNYLRYARDFPDDVTYTIGKSKADTDWNFAQWGRYTRNPVWTVRFDQLKTLSGHATLSLGVCASSKKTLQVGLNGQPIIALALPRTDGAPYRSAGQDCDYHVYTITFDASRIHSGTNELTLAIQEAKPYSPGDKTLPGSIGAIMYDALRLEVAP